MQLGQDSELTELEFRDCFENKAKNEEGYRC